MLPELILIQTKQLFKITKTIITVGRSIDCDFIIQNKAVSRRHATIVLGENGYIISDGDLVENRFSSNGILVNKNRLDPNYGHILKHGDEIDLALGITLKFFYQYDAKESDKDSTLL